MNTLQIENLLFSAASAHQRGQLREAAQLYQQVISADAHNALANHNLGIVMMQTGQSVSAALPLFATAWQADPQHAQHWSSYLRALVQANDIERAHGVYASGTMRGLRGPDVATLQAQAAAKKTAPSTATTAHAVMQLDLRREQAELEQSLGARQFDLAERQAQLLASKYPQHPLGWKALAATLLAQQRESEALVALSHCVRLTPNDLTALMQLGELLGRGGRFGEAEAAFSQALRLNPRLPAAMLGRGAMLLKLYRFADAEAAARSALLLGDFPEAHTVLGDAQLGLQHVDAAIDSYQRALALRPGDVEIYKKLGTLLFDARTESALLALIQQMTRDAPNYVEAYSDLGAVLLRSGRLPEAVSAFRHAVRLRPEDLSARESLLFCANYLSSEPSQTLRQEALDYGQQARAQAQAYTQWNAPLQPKHLRIGLVSGDLRAHPVAYFLASVLAHTASMHVEWYVYSTSAESDAMTVSLRAQVQSWRVLAGLSVQDSARMMHADNVHILIDLAGHSALNALRVFAWRPAPVQVSWLGYFASTGLSEIDYLIADAVSVPLDQHTFFTESIWYLPETRLCFSAPSAQDDAEIPASTPPPALANGYITFGSFQTSAKLNDSVLRTWGEVLLGCANARLRIQNGELSTAEGRAELAQRLHALGIDLSRVALCPKESRARYLAQYAQVDIVLDSFPFPGGTTTCEALWMGVPTLTLQGQTMIARQGASLLTAAGLGDWIAHSQAEFVALALQKASDISALAALRASLRQRLASSALMASERFAKALSEAFWAMWQKYRRSDSKSG
jgi:protein O-GlcNAc transferase